jgi:hypothetical protein
MRRKTDIVKLWMIGFSLIFLVSVVTLGQTQDYINATVHERLNSMNYRLDKIENYVTASILALIANFIAHLVDIKSRKTGRRNG